MFSDLVDKKYLLSVFTIVLPDILVGKLSGLKTRFFSNLTRHVHRSLFLLKTKHSYTSLQQTANKLMGFMRSCSWLLKWSCPFEDSIVGNIAIFLRTTQQTCTNLGKTTSGTIHRYFLSYYIDHLYFHMCGLNNNNVCELFLSQAKIMFYNTSVTYDCSKQLS